MKLLSSTDDSLNPSAVNKVTHDIDPHHVDAQWMQPNCPPSNHCKICSNSRPVLKTSVLMPRNVQIHWQVPLNDAKISKETKTALYKLLPKYDTIISKSDNGIGHSDLIKMQKVIRPYAAPITAWPYPLALKHLDFLKQEIKHILDAGIIHKGMSPWASPIVVVKKQTWRFPTAVLLVHRL